MRVSKLKEKYINPFTDFGFKKLFGSEPNKDLLISFLNQFFPEHHRIKDLRYRKTENLGNNEFDRIAIFDIHCITQSHQRIIVEMQKAKQIYFKSREIYYSTFPIQEQAKKGDWDYSLYAVYMVAILDFNFDEEDEDKFIHFVQLKNDKNKVFYNGLTFIFIEMPKFNKSEEELETLFDKWMYVLKHLSELKKRPKVLQEKIFDKLFAEAEIAKFTKEERMEYEESLKVMRDNKNVIDYAKFVSFEEGKLEGEREGMIKGEREGMIKGEREGMIKVALNLLEKDFPVDVVAEITSLSLQEIKKLKKK